MKKNTKISIVVIMIVVSVAFWTMFFRFDKFDYRKEECLDFIIMPSPPNYKRIDKEDIKEIINLINSADKSIVGMHLGGGWSGMLHF